MKKGITFLFTMSIVIVFLNLHACKSETKTYSSDEGTVTVDRAGEEADITIKTKEGETFSMTVKKGELPKGWPSEIPVLPGGNIVFSQSAEKGNMLQVGIETKKSVADSLEFYKRTLTSRGWNVENEMSMPKMQMLNVKKDDSVAMLQIVEDGSKTHIQIILSNESS